MPLMSATRKASPTPQPAVSGMLGLRAARSGRGIIGLLLSGGVDRDPDGSGLVGGKSLDDGPGGDVDPLPDREVRQDQRVRLPAAAVGLDRGTVRVDLDDAA